MLARVTRVIVLLSTMAIGCAHASPIERDARARDEGARTAVDLCAGLDRVAIESTLADDSDHLIAAHPVTEFGGRPYRQRTLGVDLVLRHDVGPHVGLDAEELESLFACQAARYQAGLARESAARDPLGVHGVRVQARVVGGRAVVLSLRAADERAGAELARRAAALASGS